MRLIAHRLEIPTNQMRTKDAARQKHNTHLQLQRNDKAIGQRLEKRERWRTPNDSNNDWDTVGCGLWLWHLWVVVVLPCSLVCDVKVMCNGSLFRRKRRNGSFQRCFKKKNQKEDLDLEQIFLPLLRQRRMAYQSPAFFEWECLSLDSGVPTVV